jgi:hypothetical protein
MLIYNAKIEQITEKSYSIYVARLAIERWKGIGKYEKGRAVCRISKHTAQLNRHRGGGFSPINHSDESAVNAKVSVPGSSRLPTPDGNSLY